MQPVELERDLVEIRQPLDGLRVWQDEARNRLDEARGKLDELKKRFDEGQRKLDKLLGTVLDFIQEQTSGAPATGRYVQFTQEGLDKFIGWLQEVTRQVHDVRQHGDAIMQLDLPGKWSLAYADVSDVSKRLDHSCARLDELIIELRCGRARLIVSEMQRLSVERGNDRMTLEEIESEIRAAREQRSR